MALCFRSRSSGQWLLLHKHEWSWNTFRKHSILGFHVSDSTLAKNASEGFYPACSLLWNRGQKSTKSLKEGYQWPQKGLMSFKLWSLQKNKVGTFNDISTESNHMAQRLGWCFCRATLYFSWWPNRLNLSFSSECCTNSTMWLTEDEYLYFLRSSKWWNFDS